MIAYKLFRKKKNGDLTSLFINKKESLPIGEWLDAGSYPTKGYKYRPLWHCCAYPTAPHLSEKGRVWCRVQVDGVTDMKRPDSQGGTWYLASRIRILEELI